MRDKFSLTGQPWEVLFGFIHLMADRPMKKNGMSCYMFLCYIPRVWNAIKIFSQWFFSSLV